MRRPSQGRAGRRTATAASEVCKAEYVATLEEALRELEQFLAVLRQLARSGGAQALARIARLLDMR